MHGEVNEYNNSTARLNITYDSVNEWKCAAVRHAKVSAKKEEKDGDISQDEQRSLSDDVQKLTDSHIKALDELLAEKEKEIMQI